MEPLLTLLGFVTVLAICFTWFETEFFEKTAHRIARPLNKNKLYICDHCERYFRNYQLWLYMKVNNNKVNKCPHCEKSIHGDYSYLTAATRVKKEQEWMKHHPHCARITIIQYLKVMRSAKKLKALNAAEEDQKAFEAYREKHKGDMTWIDNLERRV